MFMETVFQERESQRYYRQDNRSTQGYSQVEQLLKTSSYYRILQGSAFLIEIALSLSLSAKLRRMRIICAFPYIQ